MIAQIVPHGRDVVSTAALEAELLSLGCVKVNATDRTCIWRAPNGRHLSAPDPAKVYLVPTRSLTRIRQLLETLQRLKPPPTKR